MKKNLSSFFNFLFKSILFLVVFTIFLGHTVSATQDEFEEWKKETLDSFQQYKDERDAEFIGFLKQRWTEFKAQEGLVRDKTPKPVKIPEAPKTTPPKPLPEVKIVSSIPVPKLPPPQPDLIEPPKAPDEPEQKGEAIDIFFHQTPVTFFVDPNFKTFRLNAVSQDTISEFWDHMSRGEYDPFLMQMSSWRKKLKLNDWGSHALVFQVGKQLYRSDLNSATLFTWFMVSKAGYDARVGFQGSRIYLLMPSSNVLYGLPYFTFNEKRFYAVFFDQSPEKLKNFYTYNGSYPKAEQPMNFLIQDSPLIAQTLQQKNLSFNYQGKHYDVPVAFNKTLIEFYQFYPQTDFALYFEAAMAPETVHALAVALKPILEGRKETEAVGILLRFVQTAFTYQTDDQQFGREKYLLPEETLFYPYSDCEDRSFLFAKLVRIFLKNEVVGLNYPGHIATAVRFTTMVPGDNINYNGQRYTICDPTYVNADIGMAMPQFKNVQPKIIKIETPLTMGVKG